MASIGDLEPAFLAQRNRRNTRGGHSNVDSFDFEIVGPFQREVLELLFELWSDGLVLGIRGHLVGCSPDELDFDFQWRGRRAERCERYENQNKNLVDDAPSPQGRGQGRGGTGFGKSRQPEFCNWLCHSGFIRGYQRIHFPQDTLATPA